MNIVNFSKPHCRPECRVFGSLLRRAPWSCTSSPLPEAQATDMPHDLFFVAGPVSAKSCKEKLPPLDGATPTNGRIGSWQHGPCKESKSIIENCGSQTEWKCAWSSEHLSSPSFPIRKWWFQFHNRFVCRWHREAVEMTARSESGVVVCICALQHLREGVKGSWHVWTVWDLPRTCSPGIIKAIQRFQTLACSEEGIIGSAWDSRAIQYRPWAPAAPRFTRAMICCDRSSNLAWSDIHLTVRMHQNAVANQPAVVLSTSSKE